jgi:DNA-binding NtrC family response regulator
MDGTIVNDTVSFNRDVKTTLIADQNTHRRDGLRTLLTFEDHRVIGVDNLLSLIDTLNNYHVDLLISDVNLPGIPMVDLIEYIRNKYFDIKIILLMREYSPELERRLRPFKILFVGTWPVQEALFRSVVARSLERRNELSYISY